uniref:Sulfatase n=1 Tax=Cyanothece sp. (strain PCC 7425 / ATCC 29141) TaxID=395961 RepID=B8HKJ5_CYAP4
MHKDSNSSSRRGFLKKAALMGGTLLGGGTTATAISRAASGRSPLKQPNILIVIADQLRYPAWFPNQAQLDQILPNLGSLRRRSVTFRNYYAAATDCTPARSTLLTGLYTHQTGMFLTIVAGGSPQPPGTLTEPTLDPGFPTWGAALRTFGYSTWWFGKFHENNYNSGTLEPYGFSGGTWPDPYGFPGEGEKGDPCITDQFLGWLKSPQSANQPWCTTVSLVQPHDIAYYFKLTDCPNVNQGTSLRLIKQLPANFETPDSLKTNKPSLQSLFLQQQIKGLGLIPYNGPGFEREWLELLNLYLVFQKELDVEVGRILQAIGNSPYSDNTVIIFLSDHGELGGSHGLRGKGSCVYDESMQTPLYIYDPTGRFAKSPSTERKQLVSSVDIMPLLLTLANNGNAQAWYSRYPYLSKRLNILPILLNPAARGRQYVLHTSDEGPIAGIDPTDPSTPPSHVIGYRTARAKLGLYSRWRNNSSNLAIIARGQETELYDYTQQQPSPGLWEINNVASTNPSLLKQYYGALQLAITNELRAPLPGRLKSFQRRAFHRYWQYINHPSSFRPACFNPSQAPCPSRS